MFYYIQLPIFGASHILLYTIADIWCFTYFTIYHCRYLVLHVFYYYHCRYFLLQIYNQYTYALNSEFILFFLVTIFGASDSIALCFQQVCVAYYISSSHIWYFRCFTIAIFGAANVLLSITKVLVPGLLFYAPDILLY